MSASSKSLTDLKIGFLGAGRMANALAGGMIQNARVNPANMTASDITAESLKPIAKLGVQTTLKNVDVATRSEVIIVAVKPNMVAPVLSEIAAHLTPNHLIVSIAAGVKICTIETLLGDKARVVRVMPNTPALVGAGASVFARGRHATPDDGALVKALMGSVGICEDEVCEYLLDAVTGLSGSGPAYVFTAIEALADGGVKAGLPRAMAQRLAAQTVLGAAKMVLETGLHPGQLKDDVCSPAGTTIAGMHQLEKAGFRGALINAVEAAALRSAELGQK